MILDDAYRWLMWVIDGWFMMTSNNKEWGRKLGSPVTFSADALVSVPMVTCQCMPSVIRYGRKHREMAEVRCHNLKKNNVRTLKSHGSNPHEPTCSSEPVNLSGHFANLEGHIQEQWQPLQKPRPDRLMCEDIGGGRNMFLAAKEELLPWSTDRSSGPEAHDEAHDFAKLRHRSIHQRAMIGPGNEPQSGCSANLVRERERDRDRDRGTDIEGGRTKIQIRRMIHNAINAEKP